MQWVKQWFTTSCCHRRKNRIFQINSSNIFYFFGLISESSHCLKNYHLPTIIQPCSLFLSLDLFLPFCHPVTYKNSSASHNSCSSSSSPSSFTLTFLWHCMHYTTFILYPVENLVPHLSTVYCSKLSRSSLHIARVRNRGPTSVVWHDTDGPRKKGFWFYFAIYLSYGFI